MPVPARSPQDYRRVAKFMGLYPETAIFRRFGSLTMLNLMKLQAELLALEDHIRSIGERDDASKTPNGANYSMNFHDEAQRTLLEDSRVNLEQYHSLLLKASNVEGLRKPTNSDLELLRALLERVLPGRELERTWDETATRDMVTLLLPNSTETPIRDCFNPILVDWYSRVWGGRFKRRESDDNEGYQVYDYDDSKFIKCAMMAFTITGTIIVALLPVLVILWLYHVERTVVRIGITIGFTAGIGLFLKLCTTANMKEIFGATAAFAAVEVVFIGTANGT